MLIEYELYNKKHHISGMNDNNILRYCEFDGSNLEGTIFDSTFLNCTLRNLDWYWVMFNSCLFVDTLFEASIFRGAGFYHCRFVNCRIIGCDFINDNLNGACRFESSHWFNCTIQNSQGLPDFCQARR